MRLNFPDDWLEGRRCSELHEGKEVSNSRWVNKAGSAETRGVWTIKNSDQNGDFLGKLIIKMEVESLDWIILSGWLVNAEKKLVSLPPPCSVNDDETCLRNQPKPTKSSIVGAYQFEHCDGS